MNYFANAFLCILSAAFWSVGITASASEVQERHCIQVQEPDIFGKFSTFYDKNFAPQTYKLLTTLSEIVIFECEYMYLVEVRSKPGVFGVSIAYIFSKKEFKYSGDLFIQ